MEKTQIEEFKNNREGKLGLESKFWNPNFGLYENRQTNHFSKFQVEMAKGFKVVHHGGRVISESHDFRQLGAGVLVGNLVVDAIKTFEPKVSSVIYIEEAAGKSLVVEGSDTDCDPSSRGDIKYCTGKIQVRNLEESDL